MSPKNWGLWDWESECGWFALREQKWRVGISNGVMKYVKKSFYIIFFIFFKQRILFTLFFLCMRSIARTQTTQ